MISTIDEVVDSGSGRPSEELFFCQVDELRRDEPELQLRLRLFDRRTGITYLKFEHWVTAETWRRIDQRHKELIELITRHSVTVAVRPDQTVMEVRFDGYSQGQVVDASRRLAYSTVAKSAADKAAGILGISLTTLSMGPAIERVLDNLPDEVRDIRRSLRTTRGGSLEFNAGEESETDVAAELARFLREQGGGDVRISREQVRSALRSSTADSILLFWRKQDLLSRITSHDIGPEILFIWRSSQRTATSIRYVVDSLLRARRLVGTPTTEEILERVRRIEAGITVRASDLAAQMGVDREASVNALERATRDGFLQRVFRVRTSSATHDYVNSWRTTLRELPHRVSDENGIAINVDDPTNVEVGYRRKSES